MVLMLFSFLICSLGQPALIWPLGIVAGLTGLALFWKSVENDPNLFSKSLCWFAAIQAVQLSWMTSISLTGPFLLVVWLGLALAMGIQFACLTVLVIKRRLIWSAAAFWVLMELLRLTFLSGFSFNPFGLTLSFPWWLAQWSSLFGIFFLSFLATLLNLFVFFAKKRAFYLTLSVWIIGSLLLVTFYRSHEKTFDPIKLLIVQTGKIASFTQHPYHEWQEATRPIRAFDQPVDLILLPEGLLACDASTPFLINNQWTTPIALAHQLADEKNAELIVGLQERERQAALHFLPSTSDHTSYAKRILVPIGEYIPFEWCKTLAARFGINGSFIPGKAMVPFHGKTTLYPSICYEETFGALIAESQRPPAATFINLTNDGWYPHSLLGRQHFFHARLRSIENGIPSIRCCSTGVSAVIDHLGRVEAAIWHERPAILPHTLLIRTHTTLYPLWKDWPLFIFICLILILRLQKNYKKDYY